MPGPINNNIRPPEAPPLPASNTPTVIERVDAAAQPALPTSEDNQLQVLPDSIGGALAPLQILWLNNNQLQELPDSIGALAQLQFLDLSRNQLQTLPDSISDLSQLRELDLRNNQPQTLLNSNFIHAFSLSQRALSLLQRQPNSTFHFSISDSHGVEMQSLETLLNNLFLITGQEKRELPNFLKTETLRSWLSRFFNIGNLKNREERQKVLANKILGYLKLAEENEEFRTVFLRVLDEASATCGDRVLLSILQLGTQHRLAKVDLNVAEVSELLKGIWALNLLEDCAWNKVPTFPFVDEIEVHFAFPVKLKERLNLPIDVEDMLYFSLSGVTEEDLQEAEGHVRKMWDNKKAYVDFLIQQPKWLETLKASYPEKYGEIERQKESATEGDNPDYNAIANSEKQALTKLSETALSYPPSEKKRLLQGKKLSPSADLI